MITKWIPEKEEWKCNNCLNLLGKGLSLIKIAYKCQVFTCIFWQYDGLNHYCHAQQLWMPHIRDLPSFQSFHLILQAHPGPPWDRSKSIFAKKYQKHLICFIKDLLNWDNFGYVELQHILDSILKGHNTAGARGTRALATKILPKNPKKK